MWFRPLYVFLLGAYPIFFLGGFLRENPTAILSQDQQSAKRRNMGVSLFKGTQNCDFLFVSLQSQKQRLGDTPHIPYREDPPLFPTQNCFFARNKRLGVGRGCQQIDAARFILETWLWADQLSSRFC